MIVIVDYGVGNLGSILNMLRKANADAMISGSPDDIQAARGLVLPGVGHFDHCARNLRASGLVPHIEKRVLGERIPLLGICVGMQILARGSEEGSEPGLGWLPADVRRFSFEGKPSLPIPHMGWGDLEVVDDALFTPGESHRFYFVHSFHVVCDTSAPVAAWADYGGRFTAAVHSDVLFGTQFHPEKSHRHGLSLMRRFADLVGERNGTPLQL
mgnify:CR=1 FL=1